MFSHVLGKSLQIFPHEFLKNFTVVFFFAMMSEKLVQTFFSRQQQQGKTYAGEPSRWEPSGLKRCNDGAARGDNGVPGVLGMGDTVCSHGCWGQQRAYSGTLRDLWCLSGASPQHVHNKNTSGTKLLAFYSSQYCAFSSLGWKMCLLGCTLNYIFQLCRHLPFVSARFQQRKLAIYARQSTPAAAPQW